MARPFKQGCDYYPEYVNEFESNEYLLDVGEEFGPLGEAVLKRITNWVFASGYYLEVGDISKLAKRLRRSIRSKWVPNMQKIIDIINYLADIDFINKDLLQNGVVTSIDFQKTYCFLVERRKNINIDKYWLLDDMPFLNIDNNSVNVDNNSVNVNINCDNDYNKQQTKSNQTKSNQKDKYDKYDKTLSENDINYLTKILVNNELIVLDDLDLFEYDSFLERQINSGFSRKELLKVCNYVVKCMLINLTNIENKLGYFKISFEKGLKAISKEQLSFEEFVEKMKNKIKL